MKKSLVLAGLVAASTAMMAMETQYFIGVGAERGKIDMNGSINIPDYDISEGVSLEGRDTALKIKMGVILNNTHRISLSHVKFSEGDSDLSTILGNYDYLIPINNEFRVYVGGHLGKANYKETETEYLNPNMSGLAYGLQLGTTYDITKNIEFEVGLAYTKYNVNKSENRTFSESYGGYKVDIDYNTNIELDKSTSMFAGINYKF